MQHGQFWSKLSYLKSKNPLNDATILNFQPFSMHCLGNFDFSGFQQKDNQPGAKGATTPVFQERLKGQALSARLLKALDKLSKIVFMVQGASVHQTCPILIWSFLFPVLIWKGPKSVHGSYLDKLPQEDARFVFLLPPGHDPIAKQALTLCWTWNNAGWHEIKGKRAWKRFG